MADYDVIIIGGGLSGVGAAVHLTKNCPSKKFILLETRDAPGGTWDLFRYPGIRSDSDMFTLGYNFKPWTAPKAIAAGDVIIDYINETIKEYNVGDKMKFKHKVTRASWSDTTCTWTLEGQLTDTKEPFSYTTRYVLGCTGYYNYTKAYTPEIPGLSDFKGSVVHPQFWPKDYDYADKRVVVIGSGATAVTLVPAMTDKAAHVTMLQRSPTYMVARPAQLNYHTFLRKHLPPRVAYTMIRSIIVTIQMLFFLYCRAFPNRAKQFLLKPLRRHLPAGYDIEKHFAPTYAPWTQRVCLTPDADFFKAIKGGKASVVTDHIDKVVADGILLKSGERLPADIIITATGLELDILSGTEIEVAGKSLNVPSLWFYKGCMFSGLPNFFSIFGYTNSSWTLRADLSSEYACRVMNYMDSQGFTKCVPTRTAADRDEDSMPWADFSSGYIVRTIHKMPRQGPRYPWKLYQNYLLDTIMLKFGQITDGVMQFSGPNGKKSPQPWVLPPRVLIVIAVFVALIAMFFAK